MSRGRLRYLVNLQETPPSGRVAEDYGSDLTGSRGEVLG